MKKNYLFLLASLLLSTPFTYSSDTDDNSETSEISENDIGNISDLNSHSNDIETDEQESKPTFIVKTIFNALSEGTEKGVELFNKVDHKMSFISRTHDRNFRSLEYIYKNMLPKVAQEILKAQYDLLIKQCSSKISFLADKKEGFNDPYNEDNLLFESPYLTDNKILKRIIYENRQETKPVAQRTIINAITRNTSNNVKGVIFNGAPGTGKTETARALAKKLGVPFIFKKVSDIFATSFAGKASQKIKEFFTEARNTAKKSKSKNSIKVILLLDEIDNLVIKRVTDLEALSSEHGGSVMRDHNATSISFMDEFNASQQNEGILIIGTTNNDSQKSFDPAILSRFNYGMITFQKPTAEERTAYINFYIQKTIALKLKNNIWKDLEVPTLEIDEYMQMAQRIIRAWYNTPSNNTEEDEALDKQKSPISYLAQQTEGYDLRQLNELLDAIFTEQAQRLEQLEPENEETTTNANTEWATEIIQSDTFNPHEALDTFKKWPFDERCKKHMLLKALSKLSLTKSTLPWAAFCTTLGISAALTPAVIKLTPQILGFIHKKIPLTIDGRYALSMQTQKRIAVILYTLAAGYTLLKVTTKAHAASKPIIDTAQLLNFYTNQQIALTQEDVENGLPQGTCPAKQRSFIIELSSTRQIITQPIGLKQ